MNPLNDEQLALIAQRIERKADNITDRRRLVAEIERLRVALAARPQLVQVGWFEDAEQAAISLKYHQSFPNPDPALPDAVPIFVRQSDLTAAGQAGYRTAITEGMNQCP